MDRLLHQKDSKNQPIFLPTDGKTIAFKEQILPYWSEICSQIDQSQPDDLKKLFAKFKENAENSILKSSSQAGKSGEVDILNGGLIVDDSNPETSLANMKVRLGNAMKIYNVKFRQMEQRKESLDEMLSFVSRLGMVPLKDLNETDFELNIRLEFLLIETLKEAY